MENKQNPISFTFELNEEVIEGVLNWDTKIWSFESSNLLLKSYFPAGVVKENTLFSEKPSDDQPQNQIWYTISDYVEILRNKI